MIELGSLSIADIRQGSSVQRRIIAALVFREMRTRFGEMKFGYAWALIEPLAQIAILVAIFSLLGRRPPLGTSYEAFFLNGYVPYALFNQISNRAAQAISSNRALLSFPPVRNMDTVWARILLETVTGLVSMLLLIALFAHLDVPVTPEDLLQYMLGFISIILLGAGFGVLNAAISPILKWWMIVFAWFTKFQYFFCGIFFVPDFMPPGAREFVSWNPVAHSIIWIRESFYPGYNSIVLSKPFPIVTAVILIILGLAIERILRRRVDER